MSEFIALENVGFDEVIKGLKRIPELKAYRKGWNGKNIHIELQRPDENSKMTLPYLYMVTTNVKSEAENPPRGLVPWLASQTDILAEDWVVATIV